MRTDHASRWGCGRRTTTAISVVIVAGLMAAPSDAFGAARVPLSVGQPSVRVTGPGAAALGAITRLSVTVVGAPTLGAFEGALRYDDRALEIARIVWAPRTPSGGRLQGLQTADLTNRTSIGAWSCTGTACGARATSRPSARAAEIAAIDVVGLRPGAVHLRIDTARLVAADGSLLATPPAIDLTLHVGSGGPQWRAPTAAPLGHQQHGHRASTDIDADGVVSPRDPGALTGDWMVSKDHDSQCSAPRPGTDVDGDGCFTIADIQTVAGKVAVPDRTRTASVALGHANPGITTTFVVNSTGDGADVANDGSCETATSGECTLRAALQEANRSADPVEIDFNIPGGGVRTIAPQPALPQLNNPNGITIDGFTQPGASANTDALAVNAVYTIEIVGNGANSFNGFVVATAHNVFRGLDIHGFNRAFWLNTSSSNSNTIVGNMIGLLPNGNFDPGFTYVPSSTCIVLQAGASHNQIGAPGAASRNVISGCDHIGVATYLWPTKYNNIQNNIVGLDPTGTQNRGSISHGIDINTGTQFTMIGGPNAGEGNVSSGNSQEGVEISHNPLTLNNSVINNLIGTDLTGNAAPTYAADKQWGIHLEGFPNCGTSACPLDAGFNTVTGNVVVGAVRGGILVDKGVHDSVIANNKVGVTKNGTAGGNLLFGVHIEAGSVRNTVGPGNEIAYNATGIQLRPDGLEPPNATPSLTNANRITQNSIHDNNLTGQQALGIDLAPLGAVNTAANADPNINDKMLAPTLSNAQPTSITAATCAGCTVEVFLADRAAGLYGSGATYLASAAADSSGVALVSLPGGAAGSVVTATATNANASTSEFSKNVLVPTTGGGNQPPVARFSQSCSQLTCTFDGSASSDSDGTVVSYSWDFGDGSTATGAKATHTYATAGSYGVRLTVTDNQGATGTQLTSISPKKLPPVAAFTWKCVQHDCAFDGGVSVDGGGTIISYLWTLGDGATAAGRRVRHIYASAGVRTVTLSIADDGGTTNQESAPVTVTSTTTTTGNSVFRFGPRFAVAGTYTPIAGDFNGDHSTDILWYAPGPDQDSLWYATATGFALQAHPVINGEYRPLVGDFNGDGFADILWYAPGRAADHLWYGTTTGFTTGPDPVINGTYRPAVGDFNGDGFADIVWAGPSASVQPLWNGSSSGFLATHLALAARGVPVVGDFNGDGYKDVLWYLAGPGDEAMWTGSPSGLSIGSHPTINGTYFPIVGDFNGDGSDDVLWYAPGPAADSVWFGAHAGLQPGPHVLVNGAYLPIQGDFNGDHKGDVFWYAGGSVIDSLWYGN